MSEKKSIFQFSPPQILVLGFVLIILLGAAVLSTPFAAADGQASAFVDALFTATSAVCVTGLTVVSTGNHYSLFGQLTIMALVQIGGLGFMTMATLFALMLRKKISFRERLILQQAMNQTTMEGIVRLIRKVVIYSVVIEAVGAALYTLRWSLDMSFGKALYFGLFHAVSLFNNAGFDLFGDSLMRYVNDPLTNLVTITLIILGGLGFVVISDLLEYGKNRRYRLSLHSKVVLTTTGGLIVFAAVVIFIFEFTNSHTLGPLHALGKVFSSLFQAVTPRSAGVTTIPVSDMRQATQFFFILLMFIGASPGSTGGGIKTTTFATLLGAMFAMARGKDDIVLFHYRLGRERIFKAVTITLLSLFMITTMAMVLSATEDQQFLKLLFEATSAFTTTGLSMGLTPQLSTFGKIVITLTMFIGRLGPLTLAFAMGRKKDKELYRHPEGSILIG